MLVNVFSGGLNTRIAPQMLKLNEGVEYVNIDETVGTLISVKDKLATDIAVEQYPYYFDTEARWLSFPIFTSVVPYNSSLIFCNGLSSGRITNGVQYPLGIQPPISAGVLTAGPVPATPASINVAHASGAGSTALPVQMYEYLIINASVTGRSLGLRLQVQGTGAVTTLDNDIDNATPPSYVTTPASGHMTITFTAPATAIGNVGFEVYRLYQGAYRLIGVMPTPLSAITDDIFIVPSTARVLKDSDFPKLKGTYQYLLTFYNSVTGVESAASPVSPEMVLPNGGVVNFASIPTATETDSKRLYRIGGALSNFALVATLTAAQDTYIDNVADNFIDGRILNSADFYPAPEGLTFVEHSSGMLFGAVGSKLRFTPIAKPDAWPLAYEVPFESAITGLAEVANGVLVFTRHKTYLMTGTGPTTLARQLVDSTQGCVSPASIRKLAGAALWLSSDGVCTSNGGPAQVLSRDKLGKLSLDVVSSAMHDDTYYLALANGKTFVMSMAYGLAFKYLALDIITVVAGNDKLYGWQSGVLHELFAGTQDLEFEYLSPRFIEGRATEAKTYKKVYFYAKGDIIIDIIIDDAIVLAGRKLDSGIATQVQPPQEQQRGNYIQFRIRGRGELLEFEYTAEGRQ